MQLRSGLFRTELLPFSSPWMSCTCYKTRTALLGRQLWQPLPSLTPSSSGAVWLQRPHSSCPGSCSSSSPSQAPANPHTCGHQHPTALLCCYLETQTQTPPDIRAVLPLSLISAGQEAALEAGVPCRCWVRSSLLHKRTANRAGGLSHHKAHALNC